MSSVRISLLGTVRVTHPERPAENTMGHAVKALLGYLTLFRHRFHAREVLAGLFWGDSSEKRARSCLSTTLWRLRKVLEPGEIPTGAFLVATPNGEVGFNRHSNHWLDVAAFEIETKQLLAKHFSKLTAEDVGKLENALTIYKGDLLEGYYKDWALRERERLRSLYLKSLNHLLRYFSHHGAYEEGLACGRKILNLDPLREEIHREMMLLYYRCGQRALALKQYEKCMETLDSELGVSPMEETQILYNQIFQRSGSTRIDARSQGDIIRDQRVLNLVQETLRDFEKSTEQLQQSARNLKRAMTDRMSGDRRRRIDDRRQMTEDRRRRTEDRRQKTDGRR